MAVKTGANVCNSTEIPTKYDSFCIKLLRKLSERDISVCDGQY